MKASEKRMVKALNKTSTHAGGILPLAQEGARGTHKLLIIGLDQARHSIPIPIGMDLADVVQSCVGLVTIQDKVQGTWSG